MLIFNVTVWVILFLLVAIRFVRCIRLVPTQKEYIVERLGRYHRTLGAGFHILVPFFDRVAFIQDLKEESIEVPPQECFTKDNVKVEVDGVIYMSVVNSKAASYGIINYRYAAVQLAQTTTRSVIGTLELDRTFEERDAINSRVVSVLGEVSDTWGIRVHRYEVKNIVPPTTVRDAMERQMAAERERRAILARAEGEKQARINKSEGRMAEMINRSEGEQQRRINEAEGHAEEILTVARATAESITKLAGAIAAPGGLDATRLRLCQQYLERLGSLARESTAVLLPADLTRLDTLLESLAFGKLANRIFPAVSSPPPSERGERLQPPLAAAAAPFASGTPDLSPKGPETEPPPVVAQVLEPQLTSPRASGVPRVVSEVPLAFGAKTAGQPAPAEILERRSFEPTPVTQPPIAPAPTAPQPAVTAPVVPRAPTAPQPAVTAPVVPRAPTAPQPAVTAPVVPRAPTAPQPAVTAPVVPRAPTAPQPAVT
ncbi:MAG: hypothetical protein JW797_06805, partial [Bradymonadales bacterium]|nr:hypothetical protein [Bradymonadales bacterium]